MGALLIEEWLGAADRIAVVDDASISEVREAVRARCQTIHLPAIACENLVSAASELARNQLAHGTDGIIGLRSVERGSIAGVEVIAADRGRGIADPSSALRGTPRVEGSLGVGLSAAARQTDELDLDVRIGAGTCVRIRSFVQAVRKSEIGVMGVAHPSETVIGDHATFVRDADGLTIAVVDGLGHGVLAREAADRAIGELLRDPDRPIAEVLSAAHAALPGTRGAVMAVARFDAQGAFDYAGVGNIAARVLAIDGTAHPLPSMAGTLGSTFPRKIHVEHVAFRTGQLLVMSSDGLKSQFDLAHEPVTIRQHPIVIAQTLLSRFGRGTDDALVAVVR